MVKIVIEQQQSVAFRIVRWISFTEIRVTLREHHASLSIEKDGGRKMAVEKARERNKKGQEEGREGRWWRVTLSFRYELPGRNEAEGEASNSSWNLGNARGPKSFRCSTGRKNVSVSAIKGFESFYGKFKVASPRQNYYAYLVYMHEERCWNLFFNLRIIFVKTFETG